MLRSSIEDERGAWSFFEPLTLLSRYKMLQHKVVEFYRRYENVVKRYSETVNRKVCPLTDEYLEGHKTVADENVVLLKNAMELWRMATQTSETVAPILYHYSWHCFNAFFVYTLFYWKPQHSTGHGLKLIWIEPQHFTGHELELNHDLDNIGIEIQRSGNGIFQRLVDTWNLIAVPLAFSPVLPLLQDDKLTFEPNDEYLLGSSGRLSLKKLLDFNPKGFEDKLFSKRKDQILNSTVYLPYFRLANKSLKSFLIFFVSSSLARYRPALWQSILAGETEEQSDFAEQSAKALRDYTMGSNLSEYGFLVQVMKLFREIKDGTFKFIRARDGEEPKTL